MTAATSAAAATLAKPVTYMHALSDFVPWKNQPPSVGPAMNANVQHASRHAMNLGSCFSVATSARYAFTMGEAPAKAPEQTRNARNAPRLHPFCTHCACAMSPHPTPNSESAKMGLRPTSSLRRGHAKSAKNMPRGYALVRYPTCDGCSAKCCTNPGVMGPVTVNPRRCRNTASITHATLACLRHAGRDAGRIESLPSVALAAGTTSSPRRRRAKSTTRDVSFSRTKVRPASAPREPVPRRPRSSRGTRRARGTLTPGFETRAVAMTAARGRARPAANARRSSRPTGALPKRT